MNLRQQLKNPASGLIQQLIRYFFSGGLATLVDIGILWLITDVAGWHYQVGVALGYLAGLTITYTMATLWIFDQHRTDNHLVELLGFVVIGAIGMGATHGLMWFFTEVLLGQELYIVAKLITTVVVSLLNFILKKYILFTHQ